MGIYHRYSTALIALFVFSLPALATERVRVDPYIKAGPGYSATTGSITGYVPTKSNQDLLLEAERKGWLGNGSAKTPVTIKAKVKASVGGISGKLKNLVKTNPARVALGAATSAAVAGVGWVMTDGTKIQKVEKEQAPIATFSWSCSTRASGSHSTPLQSGEACATALHTFNTNDGAGWTRSGVALQKISETSYSGQYQEIKNGVVNRYVGFNLVSAGTCSSNLDPDGGCRPETGRLIDVQDADLDALDSFVSTQSGEWLKGLLKESCEASNNPQGCYDDLQKQSAPLLSGPSSVAGPSSTTSGTYTRPDGSTGTTGSTTQTNYDIRYGDNYFDYDTTVTTTTTKDGVQTGEETTTDSGTPQEQPPSEEEQQEEQYTFDDSDLPEIAPFYEQKYPDGFNGVWNDAKSDFENSEFVSFMQSFVPSFSGTCPSWSMNFAIGALANFGTIPFQSLCYIFDFIKVIMLVTAVFTSRAIMFGG